MKLYEAVSIAASRCIRHALRRTNGNYTHAAKLLGINRTHLHRLMGKIPKRPRFKVIQELANWRRA